MKIDGESLVLPEQNPANLCFGNLVPTSIIVRSTYLADQKDTIVYKQGRDYTVNYVLGTISRTRISRIPDFSKNPAYGKKDFDHNKIPGIGNHQYFVWVDYETLDGQPFAAKNDQSALLKKTLSKLKSGEPLKIVVYGDSISTGCEASTESLRFPNRYAAYLSSRFPKAKIALENGATGGDTSEQGVSRLEEKVLSRNPDLVLLGFGMNDHNVPPSGVKIPKFQENLAVMVKSIMERTGAEVIILSAFPPNPDWKFGSHRMGDYAEATKQTAHELNCAYADVYDTWTKVLKRKDLPSLLGNNINHPNDFGHWLYLQALEAVGL